MIEYIELILNRNFKEDTSTVQFSLLEESEDAKCKEAIFEYTSGECLAYKFDKRDSNHRMIEIFPFFANVTNVKKMCDYLIFYENAKGKLFVILCNLKSDLAGTNAEQIKAAELFADFICNTARRISGQNFAYEKVKVYYRSRNLKRRGTNARNARPNSEHHFTSNSKIMEVCKLHKICK